METRPLGTTGQESTILTFGAIALDSLTQSAATRLVELVRSHGVNHVDVAPSYGTAEEKLAPALDRHRDDLFIGCKTLERDREGAQAELDQSLERMGLDRIDLYQFHAVTSRDDIDAITDAGGALETFEAAKADGVIDHIGLTSHGPPDVILEAIDRIDVLETVMFPLNYVLLGLADPEHDYSRVLDRLDAEGMGALGIKAFARGPWPPEGELPPERRPYSTWYEPHDTQPAIDDCLRFALSQGLTSITNAGDPKLLPMILNAADRFERLDEDAERALLERGRTMDSPVPAQ